jgi:hypothetical protein
LYLNQYFFQSNSMMVLSYPIKPSHQVSNLNTPDQTSRTAYCSSGYRFFDYRFSFI